jgi:hypothetical protein
MRPFPMKPLHLSVPFSAIARHAAAFLLSFSFLVLPGSLTQAANAADLDVGLTSFSVNAERQDVQVDNLKKTGYDVAVPLNVKDLNDKLGDGSFQIADLDFSSSVPSIPKTNKRIGFEAPLAAPGTTSLLYSVVAGIPDPTTCPVEIKETKIAFFSDKQKSNDAAAKLSADGYLVYVTGNTDVQDAARKQIEALNCKPNAQGVVVNGKTKFVSVDFTNIWELLPKDLQQPAKNSPFTYKPSASSDAIYLVNGRQEKKSA